jgi:UDP-2,3-diacylglucosamine hydrolase
MARPDYIVSDVHLGAVPRETERRFVSFLEHAASAAAQLLIAGDLFDFWFEYGTVIPGKHFRVLGALAALVDAGVPVTFAGGNHDAWGGRFLREEVGVAFQMGPFRMTLGGRSALIAHGDGLGRGDLKYRFLKSFLRNRVTVLGFRAIHPEIGLRIARAVSTTEAKAENDPGVRGRAKFLEDWAGDRLAEDPSLSFVVCGHAHLPQVREVSSGRFYLNAGDWITHDTYIVVPPGGVPALERWGQAARP